MGRPKGKGKSRLDQFQPEIEALLRNGSKKNPLVPQSDTTFVCPACQWGQPYVFSREGGGMAPQVSEVQVSGAWVFKRVK